MSEKLKKLMADKNVTQAELAEVIGVSQVFVCKMLKGYKMPSVDVLVRIADFFDVSVDFLAR